jgi:hypothetical protein
LNTFQLFPAIQLATFGYTTANQRIAHALYIFIKRQSIPIVFSFLPNPEERLANR